jgi:hypothetical protein
MTDRTKEIVWAGLGGLLIWIIGECIATWLHVQAMKKFSVCPYAAQMNKNKDTTQG